MQKFWQDISLGVSFHDSTPISLIKSYGIYFHAGKFLQRLQYFEEGENYHQIKISTFIVYIHPVGANST